MILTIKVELLFLLSFAYVSGYYGRLKEGIFSCGLQGINENDKENVENLIYETIEKTCRLVFCLLFINLNLIIKI